MDAYDQTIKFLFSQLPMYQRLGPAALKYDLSGISNLMEVLGNPQNDYPTIHVAGTNGKGSVSHMIASIFQAAGYSVGLHTSPHYIDFRERIKVNGYLINKKDVTHFVNKLEAYIGQHSPSFFELAVAMAFDHFSNKKVDIAIIETGLGGRLDSTNIINPILSIITNIDYDHQEFLGNTLRKIAKEKAGIIKKNTPTVLGQVYQDLIPVFEKVAKPLESEIHLADLKYLIVELPSKTLEQSTFQIFDEGQLRFKSLALDASGPFQMHNLRTSLQAIDVVKSDWKITDDHIRNGLKEMEDLTYYIGRWNWLSKKPYILADSAHNASGLSYVADWLAMRTRDLHIVIGMVEGKDAKSLLSLFPKRATYYFCKPNVPRGLPIKSLQEACRSLGLLGDSYNSVKLAIAEAKSDASDEGLIFVGGSSFVVAEALI